MDCFVCQSLVPSESRLVIDEDGDGLGQSGDLLASRAMSVKVPTSQVRPGDSVLVLPGETIPVDVSTTNYHHLFLCMGN